MSMLPSRYLRKKTTHAIEESIAVPIPSAEQLDTVAFRLRPSIAVRQRGKKPEDDNGQGEKYRGASSVDEGALSQTDTGNSGSDEVKDLAESDDGKVQGGEVVMKEELTLHEIEWEVVECPAQHRGADLVIEAFESLVGIVAAAALPPKDSEPLKQNIDDHCSRGTPPNEGVADQVNLGVVLAPEVNTAAEKRPGLGAGIPCVRLDKAGVCLPHNLLELPELSEETGVRVVHSLGTLAKRRVLILLNVPNTVGESTAFSASDFLLLRSPVRKLDLVREQNASGHNVNKSELGVNGADTLSRDTTFGLLLDDLDAEEVVGISVKAFVSVRRYLVLPVDFRDRRADVMGVKATEGVEVEQTEDGAVLNIGELGKVVPRISSIDRFTVDVERLGLVLEQPDVVVVLVGIQCDLLLLGSCRVHQGVRVQITTLGIDMSDADSAAHQHVGGNVLHALGVQGRLELRAHEAVALAGVDEAEEVDSKHGHVEGHGDDDQGEDTGHEVLGKETDGDILVVAEHNPELDQGQGTDPGDGEETNPLDAESDAQTEASHDQPEPPARLEGLGRTKLLLVGERGKGKRSERRSNHERGVEQDQTCLSQETVLEDDEACAKCRGRSAATSSLQCEEHSRGQEDAAQSGKQAHGDIWNAGLDVILANLLEVEISIKSSQPAEEGDHQFRERGVNIHEEAAFDVLGSKTTEAVAMSWSALLSFCSDSC